ncbi:diguanylate cyclase [Candidatus Sumerlaeota bacterium]|nr:diguanylate cyclase [Candidatus Sumerlaeota bacterium]MBI3737276.1 diguanylate cyclase [Candidatus Sumerlaeota bacterium]
MAGREKLTLLTLGISPLEMEQLRSYLQVIEGWDSEFIVCSEAAEGLRALADRQIDVVLLEQSRGLRHGADLLRAIGEMKDSAPAVIVFAAQASSTEAREMRQAGVTDYLDRSRITPEALHRAVLNAFEKTTLQRKIEIQRRQLDQLERYDFLTSLLNRRAMMDDLLQEMLRAHRYASALSILILDIDSFKYLNKMSGPLIGDYVLLGTSELLRRLVRETDIAGRVGGDEFCVILPQTDLIGARTFAERIREGLGETVFENSRGDKFYVRCSIGLAALGPEMKQLTDFVRAAAEALQKARQGGGNRVCAHGVD